MEESIAVPIHEFLHAKLIGTDYCSQRGRQRHISLLHRDMVSFYQSLEDNPFLQKSRLEKIFMGYRWDFREICMLAMFLQISPEELVERPLLAQDATEEFDREIFRLRELGMSYPMIGRTMGASINVVKPIGERRYVSSGGVKHYRRKPGAKEKDWATLDEEMLPRIKEIIDELEGDGISRPRRVKVHTVQMKAGLKAKALQKMPQCLELVVKHRQPLEVYWAKEIAWAVKDVDRTGDPWQWTSIRRRTNMKRRDLKACLPCFMFWTERSIIFNVLAETWNGWVNSRGSRILFGHHNVSGFISVRENSRRRLASSFASGGMF